MLSTTDTDVSLSTSMSEPPDFLAKLLFSETRDLRPAYESRVRFDTHRSHSTQVA